MDKQVSFLTQRLLSPYALALHVYFMRTFDEGVSQNQPTAVFFGPLPLISSAVFLRGLTTP